MANPNTTWTEDPSTNPSVTWEQPTRHVRGGPMDMDVDPMIFSEDPVLWPPYTETTYTADP